MQTVQQLRSEDTARRKQNKSPFFPKYVVQAKLQVNEPGDSYEHEANAMADQVMRMTDNSINQNSFFKPAVSSIQRKCQHCEEAEKLQRKERSDDEVEGDSQLDSYVASLGSLGQPLPETSRKFFEPRFGHDFSNVRVHNDSVAAKSAQSINALAYTTGNNIVFNNGQFSPGSDSGKRLMAHELTHVVQQNTGLIPRFVQRDEGDDEQLGLTANLASSAAGCMRMGNSCYGKCTAADGTIGACFWNYAAKACGCRSNRGSEPGPSGQSVPFWVYALGAAAVIALVACFASGVCEAGAIIGAVGAGAAAGIIALLRASGIQVNGGDGGDGGA